MSKTNVFLNLLSAAFGYWMTGSFFWSVLSGLLAVFACNQWWVKNPAFGKMPSGAIMVQAGIYLLALALPFQVKPSGADAALMRPAAVQAGEEDFSRPLPSDAVPFVVDTTTNAAPPKPLVRLEDAETMELSGFYSGEAAEKAKRENEAARWNITDTGNKVTVRVIVTGKKGSIIIETPLVLQPGKAAYVATSQMIGQLGAGVARSGVIGFAYPGARYFSLQTSTDGFKLTADCGQPAGNVALDLSNVKSGSYEIVIRRVPDHVQCWEYAPGVPLRNQF